MDRNLIVVEGIMVSANSELIISLRPVHLLITLPSE
jgi:hypothetical protein